MPGPSCQRLPTKRGQLTNWTHCAEWDISIDLPQIIPDHEGAKSTNNSLIEYTRTFKFQGLRSKEFKKMPIACQSLPSCDISWPEWTTGLNVVAWPSLFSTKSSNYSPAQMFPCCLLYAAIHNALSQFARPRSWPAFCRCTVQIALEFTRRSACGNIETMRHA